MNRQVFLKYGQFLVEFQHKSFTPPSTYLLDYSLEYYKKHTLINTKFIGYTENISLQTNIH